MYTATYFFETLSCVEVLRYFAGWCDKNHGKTMPTGELNSCDIITVSLKVHEGTVFYLT